MIYALGNGLEPKVADDVSAQNARGQGGSWRGFGPSLGCGEGVVGFPGAYGIVPVSGRVCLGP